MLNTAIFDNILSQFKQLDREGQLRLIEKLISQLRISRQISKEKKNSLMDLKELGAGQWKDIDIDEYIKEGRKW